MRLFEVAELNGIGADAWHNLAHMSRKILPHRLGNGNNNTSYYLLPPVLREHLMHIVKALRAGTLRIKKVLHYRGQTIEYLAKPGPAEWLSIATYATTVANLTYRALGGFGALGGYTADVTAGTPAPAPPVTIVLPGVVARPRAERCLETQSQVVDQGDQNAAGQALLPPPQAQNPDGEPPAGKDPAESRS
jgi:hypothetical protein